MSYEDIIILDKTYKKTVMTTVTENDIIQINQKLDKLTDSVGLIVNRLSEVEKNQKIICIKTDSKILTFIS